MPFETDAINGLNLWCTLIYVSRQPMAFLRKNNIQFNHIVVTFIVYPVYPVTLLFKPVQCG